MVKNITTFLIVLLLIIQGCGNELEEKFKNPSKEFKPMPFWHINGELTTEGIRQQMIDAKEKAGFTGVSLLPLAPKGDRPGTTPKFLSDDYFDRFQDVLNTAEELNMQVILYDDNDFPSGMAGGLLQEKFPDHTMKRLDNVEKEVTGPTVFQDTINAVKLMAAVAMNTDTKERIELSNFVQNDILTWEVPEGTWKVMLFSMVKDSFHKAFLCVDFLDTTAVRHMINLTYEAYAKRYSSYFGNIIKMTFFDDVGFWRHPRTWTGKFNEKFIELNGYDPKPYYPAMWHDIGPETESVRYAFYNTRAELLAEGFPKLAAEWNDKYGLKSTGHPPGNYDPTPIDMNGDIFKFFRYTQVPLTDAIIDYQFGQDGHKLISSAADYYDRPVVSTEIYGAFKENIFDSLMLYRPMMELFVRGVNLVIPHGLWYNPDHVYIPPLVSPYSEKLQPALPKYSDFVGRSCLLLQGGRRVADIGVMYPFESLAAWYRFEDPDNPRQGFFVSPETDYQAISSLLSNEIRRDFTFVHPEFFLDDKYLIEDKKVKLNNAENYQEYKIMIITGSKSISYKTLEKLKSFYDNGGTIISTTILPTKSSEMGADQKVINLVKDIFGIDALDQDTTRISTNDNNDGGRAIFIPSPNKENLQAAMNNISRDVLFTSDPTLSTDFGKFSYIHKIKDGRDIFYFANSSDETIETEVLLKGELKLEAWDPRSGKINKQVTIYSKSNRNVNYTKIKLKLGPVSSSFYVSK
ncbi:MAG: hypothetical protein JXQ96_12260 [Cyclobacteriaceae bacterium]